MYVCENFLALNFDSNDIIGELKNGNEKVLVFLYKEYRDEFIQFAHKNYGLSREELKDVFQETIIAFHQNVISGRLQNLTSDVKTYLFAIGKRQASTHKKNLSKSVTSIPRMILKL
jgi:hypothetical protein